MDGLRDRGRGWKDDVWILSLDSRKWCGDYLVDFGRWEGSKSRRWLPGFFKVWLLSYRLDHRWRNGEGGPNLGSQVGVENHDGDR